MSWWRGLFCEAIPGGAGWRRTWSAVLLFTFFLQAITGFFLLTHYSGSTQTAWESVYYLQYHVSGGWLLRGIHAVTAQAMVLLLALHLMQVAIQRAYLAPRQLNFLLLLVLLPLALALSVTGWLLPFDQKGYWSARVPLNLLGMVPAIGPALQTVLMGGTEVSHYTLTRFVALHTVLLPLCLGLGLVAYHRLTRRPAVDASAPPATPAAAWCPDQLLRDAVASVAVLVAVLFVVLWPRWTGGGEGGPTLLAPADATEPYGAARPEWFMLWLFQLLKFFPGGTEVWGAVGVPAVVLAVLAAMPWVGRWRLGRRFNTAFALGLGGGMLALTLIAVSRDRRDPQFQAAVREADLTAERAKALSGGPDGIPPTGALTLLERDPLTQGPRLFARHCASCHRYDGHDGLGGLPADAPSASDLKSFGSRAWLRRLLDPVEVDGPKHFGGTRFSEGRMVRFVKRGVAEFTEEQQAQLEKVIAAVSAEAELPGQRALDDRDQAAIETGRQLIRTEDMRCTECHQFRQPDEDASAPDLTGYGSRAWLFEFISNPSHPRFYGRRNDRMPAYGANEVLDAASIGLLTDWLREAWYQPTSGP
ncbi:MAG: menaquinol-cytochrome C reductase [Verrucomicrobia bacterium]|nr:menaquinol-cytochrome C reductase [Verrucomicrobiota bacterium]